MAKAFGCGPGAAGLAGGMIGGIVQAYATMGFCTCMKTAEITRHKQMEAGVKPPSTWAMFADIFRREGIRGINKGVNAVAIRQCTNWGSRYVAAVLTVQYGLCASCRGAGAHVHGQVGEGQAVADRAHCVLVDRRCACYVEPADRGDPRGGR